MGAEASRWATRLRELKAEERARVDVIFEEMREVYTQVPGDQVLLLLKFYIGYDREDAESLHQDRLERLLAWRFHYPAREKK